MFATGTPHTAVEDAKRILENNLAGFYCCFFLFVFKKHTFTIWSNNPISKEMKTML